jgi:hypothetical protein
MLDFQSTCQIGRIFTDMDLRGANFSNCDLSYARFENCDLYEANFAGAMLYHCSFSDCELTKASFEGTYLSGFRMRGGDLTHAEFDLRPAIGAVRKPLRVAQPESNLYESRGWLSAGTGEAIPAISTIEAQYRGIYSPDFHSAVVFSTDAAPEKWRSSRRREEVCKILRVQLQANGYSDKALDFYFEERRFRRRAIRPGPSHWPRRFVDFLFGELFWGYSTRPLRPVATYAILLTLTSVAYLFLPGLLPAEGVLASDDSGAARILSWDDGAAAFAKVCYFLATCAFGTSSFEPTGSLAQLMFALYCVASLAILTLMFAAIARRIGQS